jgi:hypothetical protein
LYTCHIGECAHACPSGSCAGDWAAQTFTAAGNARARVPASSCS